MKKKTILSFATMIALSSSFSIPVRALSTGGKVGVGIVAVGGAALIGSGISKKIKGTATGVAEEEMSAEERELILSQNRQALADHPLGDYSSEDEDYSWVDWEGGDDPELLKHMHTVEKEPENLPNGHRVATKISDDDVKKSLADDDEPELLKKMQAIDSKPGNIPNGNRVATEISDPAPAENQSPSIQPTESIEQDQKAQITADQQGISQTNQGNSAQAEQNTAEVDNQKTEKQSQSDSVEQKQEHAENQEQLNEGNQEQLNEENQSKAEGDGKGEAEGGESDSVVGDIGDAMI